MSNRIIEDQKEDTNDIIAFNSCNTLDNYYSTTASHDIKNSIAKSRSELEAKLAKMKSSTQEDNTTNTNIKESINAFFHTHNSIISRHLESQDSQAPSLDNYIRLKEQLAVKLQSKNNTLILLTKAKNILSSIDTRSASLEDVAALMKEIKGNKEIALNKQLHSSLLSELKKLLKQVTQSQLNPQESDKEDDPSLSLFSKLIKTSYEEALSNCIIGISPIEILKELNFVSSIETSNNKANELKEKYIISPSFKLFIIQLFNKPSSLASSSASTSSFSDFKKIIALLHLLYGSYCKKIELSFNDVSNITQIQMHNNIELLLIAISYQILFPQKQATENDARDYSNIFIFLKNFSSELISQVISCFISQLTTQMYQIETFENISYGSNFLNCKTMFKNTQALIYKFFNSLKQYAIQREFVFNLNYVLSLLFDVLNRKILLVKDFSVNDIKSLLSLGKKIAPKLKANLELIAEEDSAFSEKLIRVLDQNSKYKIFEEILFVLNANLKEIRNFLIESEFSIHIDPNELIELIASIFEKNENSTKLLEFIKEKLLFQ